MLLPSFTQYLYIGLSLARPMDIDEKIRYGMLGLSGASIVFAALGLHIGPLEISGGFGVG